MGETRKDGIWKQSVEGVRKDGFQDFGLSSIGVLPQCLEDENLVKLFSYS